LLEIFPKVSPQAFDQASSPLMSDPIEFYTLDEVRGLIGCSKSKLYKDRRAGKLQVVKFGGLVRVTRSQFEAYLRRAAKASEPNAKRRTALAIPAIRD
jgi:excisionase family DNA binding protein